MINALGHWGGKRLNEVLGVCVDGDDESAKEERKVRKESQEHTVS